MTSRKFLTLVSALFLATFSDLDAHGAETTSPLTTPKADDVGTDGHQEATRPVERPNNRMLAKYKHSDGWIGYNYASEVIHHVTKP